MGVAVSQTHGFLRHRLDGCYSLLLNELQVQLTAEYTNSGKRDPPRSVRALIGLWSMELSDRSGKSNVVWMRTGYRGGGDGELDVGEGMGNWSPWADRVLLKVTRPECVPPLIV